ncbi:MAG: hypothetical protein UU23_C0001G0124 [Candidatus Curtissbacteria bacterium GW2011_GWA1_40_9]|uniref:Uncharacterized protein n=1 Tax=Candidatus Curtissbacteria bacterium GW2011_GWA1_40_9 TaxID=1618408 RepID=A0A0G0W245_9BACT|nr:MAG: hypothetical protein UU23_C0001G0124 [Candidatus Curtissbacteria bacterium GW2011_GWA1_40_9]
MLEAGNSRFDQEYINYRTVDVAERIHRTGILLNNFLVTDSVEFDNKYNTTTSEGTAITIDVFKSKSVYPYFFMIASSSGQVFGMRTTRLSEELLHTNADGEIMVLPKLRGVSTALELVNSMTLQADANLRNKPVVYQADPANLRRLAQIGEMAEGAFHYQERLSYYELYQRKEKEHQRWLALYGNDGLCGFNDFQRQVAPDLSLQKLPNGSIVKLGREYVQSESGRRLIKPTVIEIQKWNHNDDELARLEELILPQLRDISRLRHNPWQI